LHKVTFTIEVIVNSDSIDEARAAAYDELEITLECNGLDAFTMGEVVPFDPEDDTLSDYDRETPLGQQIDGGGEECEPYE
jgi:hypothetical protein